MTSKNIAKIIFITFAVVIAYIAFLPNYKELPDLVSISGVINHFVAFLVLAFFLDRGFSVSAKMAFILLFIYGFFIEAVQYFLPNRCFELLDLVVDMSGVLVFYSFNKYLKRSNKVEISG